MEYYIFWTLIIIFFVILPLFGLIFFIRSLMRKENIGCGVAGLLPLIFIATFFITINYTTTHISDSNVKARFEKSTDCAFPHSGKIIEKEYKEFNNILGDSHCAFMIEMDTLDYNQILQKVQASELEYQVTTIFQTDTLDYRKIVDNAQFRYIFDTLVSRKILNEAEVNRILSGDEFSCFTETARTSFKTESSFLLEKQFSTNECAYTMGPL